MKPEIFNFDVRKKSQEGLMDISKFSFDINKKVKVKQNLDKVDYLLCKPETMCLNIIVMPKTSMLIFFLQVLEAKKKYGYCSKKWGGVSIPAKLFKLTKLEHVFMAHW